MLLTHMTTNPYHNKMFIKVGNHIIYNATIQKPPPKKSPLCVSVSF